MDGARRAQRGAVHRRRRPRPRGPVTRMYDLLIRGGTLIDGSGAAPFRADVGISGARIVDVGALDGAAATTTIDAHGLSVAPGFIDTHTHTEGTLLLDPQHENGLR